MAEFLNNWIYTKDLTGDLSQLGFSKLSLSWRDPVTRNSYSNFSALAETDVETLNNIGWYKVLENIVTPTIYQNLVLGTRTFNEQTFEFTDTYIAEYKDIESIRNIKLSELHTIKINTIESHFDYLTDTEKFHSIYKSIGLLIQSFAETNPQTYVNNNTYLQAVLGRVNAMDTEVSVYNSRIEQIKVETNLQILIAI